MIQLKFVKFIYSRAQKRGMNERNRLNEKGIEKRAKFKYHIHSHIEQIVLFHANTT